MSTQIWMRAETKPGETRAPIVPEHARTLVERGVTMVVESSPTRVFPDERYAEVGCALAPAGTFREAPRDAYVVGIKSFAPATEPLRHRHVYFAHCYKGQEGWRDLLLRFHHGGGTLLDLEYLTDEEGRRLVAFGHWAGFAGAALAVLAWAAQHEGRGRRLDSALRPQDRERWLHDVTRAIADVTARGAARPTALVIGANGRSGQGAALLLREAGLPTTSWDVEHTRQGGPFTALLGHEIVVNCALLERPTQPFLTPDLLYRPRILRVLSDVSCDANSPVNPVPVYHEPTTLTRPVTRVLDEPPFDVIAIDHLPSLLPRESSTDFSAQLLPHLLELGDNAAWTRTASLFNAKVQELKAEQSHAV